MPVIDRMDWLSGCGGSQGAEQRQTVGLSAIATFVTTPLVERALFPHRQQPLLPSHLSCPRIKCGHFKVLPHTPGVPGGVFSPCLKWKGPIHHWLFCDGNTSEDELLVFVRAPGVCLHVQRGRPSLRCGENLASALVSKEHVTHQPH